MCEYDDLIRAILQRDEAGFHKALTHCDPNHQSTATGLSPIHFAVTWPIALTALIRIGVDMNIEDHFRRRPIHLATALGESEAVKILLREDCAIWTRTHSMSLLQEALNGNNKESRECVANSVITAYIDRYTRFFNLALSVLPQSSPIVSEVIPGRQHENLVPQIQQELSRQHYRIPPALKLCTDGSSVYDTADIHFHSRLTVHMAERLWKAGFQQIQHYTDRGSTPLLESWYNADFEMVKWFISKGASPFSRHEQTHGSGLHLYAHRLGFPSMYFKGDISAVDYDETLVSQLESDLDSRRDSCRCLCSVHGCVPVLIFLKRSDAFKDLTFESQSPEYQVCLNQLRLFWKKLPPARDEEQFSVETVLRFLVFKEMDLKHQCCHLGQMAEDYRVEEPVTDENPPESEREIEAKMSEYREKMRSCECEPLEKPLCVVFRDHCKSL